MEELNLDWLESGEMPGLSKRAGGNLLEASQICLGHNGHKSGIKLEVNGDHSFRYRVVWKGSIGDQEKRTFNDMQEATELGACGVACLLVYNRTRLVITRRSRKGTGFDYWLGRRVGDSSVRPQMFQDEAKLEVSGILQDDRLSRIVRRVKEKSQQVKGGSHQELPAYVVVVEFGRPLAKVVRLEGPDENQRTA